MRSDWLVFCDCGFRLSALSQRLPSYWGFSYLGRGASLHGSSSKAQLLLLTLDFKLETSKPFVSIKGDVSETPQVTADI